MAGRNISPPPPGLCCFSSTDPDSSGFSSRTSAEKHEETRRPALCFRRTARRIRTALSRICRHGSPPPPPDQHMQLINYSGIRTGWRELQVGDFHQACLEPGDDSSSSFDDDYEMYCALRPIRGRQHSAAGVRPFLKANITCDYSEPFHLSSSINQSDTEEEPSGDLISVSLKSTGLGLRTEVLTGTECTEDIYNLESLSDEQMEIKESFEAVRLSLHPHLLQASGSGSSRYLTGPPGPHLLQASGSGSSRTHSGPPRPHSCPSAPQESSANIKQSRAGSSPNLKFQSSFQEFTPDFTDDDEGDEVYRFRCSGPGLYQCRETGLVFDMKAAGDVSYRTVPWDRTALRQHHKKPAGPLFEIKCPQLSVAQLHLPHCELRSTGAEDHLSGAEDHLSGAEDHLSGAEDHLSGAEDHLSGAEDHLSGAEDHLSGAEDHLSGPEDHLSGAEDHLSGAEDHLSGAEDHLSGPEDHLSGAEDHLSGAEDHLSGAEDHLSGAEDHLSGAEDHLSGAEDHLSGAEDHLSGAEDHLSVAHVDHEGMEFIRPERMTETHVIINIRSFSAFGNVKDEDSPPDPVRALVLLFYKNPAEPGDDYLINVLLLPKNVPVGEVLRFRKKLDKTEMFLETPPHCKLQPQQVYTLSTSSGQDSVLVQPKEAEFDPESYNNYLPTFQVLYEQLMKHMKLFLKDGRSSSVWDRRVCLSSSRPNRSCGSTRQNLSPDEQLSETRISFTDGVSGPVLQHLLDKLLERKVLSDSEKEAAEEEGSRRDRARFVIDTVRKKGPAASSEMIQFLCELDPFLSEHLGLM